MSDSREWSRRLLEPRAACILDVETTGFDGSIIEIAVIDTASARTLLDTLVDPGGVAIDPGAQAVHGLTVHDLVGAPLWPDVYERLLEVVGERTILAYNAAFDRARILHDCERTGVDPGGLADENRWQCVMRRRSEALGTSINVALNGGHRALADVMDTRAILEMLADGLPDTAGHAALNQYRQRSRQTDNPARRVGALLTAARRKIFELRR